MSDKSKKSKNIKIIDTKLQKAVNKVLDGFVKVNPFDIQYIGKGSFISYLNKGKFNFGAVTKNDFPNTLSMTIAHRYSWKIAIEKYPIFISKTRSKFINLPTDLKELNKLKDNDKNNRNTIDEEAQSKKYTKLELTKIDQLKKSSIHPTRKGLGIFDHYEAVSENQTILYQTEKRERIKYLEKKYGKEEYHNYVKQYKPLAEKEKMAEEVMRETNRLKLKRTKSKRKPKTTLKKKSKKTENKDEETKDIVDDKDDDKDDDDINSGEHTNITGIMSSMYQKEQKRQSQKTHDDKQKRDQMNILYELYNNDLLEIQMEDTDPEIVEKCNAKYEKYLEKVNETGELSEDMEKRWLYDLYNCGLLQVIEGMDI
jgi:hypothetical protein